MKRTLIKSMLCLIGIYLLLLLSACGGSSEDRQLDIDTSKMHSLYHSESGFDSSEWKEYIVKLGIVGDGENKVNDAFIEHYAQR